MLVTMKDILVRASRENYGVAAPNVGHELDARAMIEAAEEHNAPIILDIAFFSSPNVVFYCDYLRRMAQMAKVPVAINQDHGATFEQAIWAIRAGMTSIMVDRSTLPFEENIAQVAEIVRIAHAVGVSVEAELGHVGSGSNYEVDGVTGLTEPSEVKEYIERTGVDCLAVAIGTSHGVYSGTPHLDFDRLTKIKKIVGPEFPLVLHGGSGTGDEKLQKACTMGINKVNIATDMFKAAAKDLTEANLVEKEYYKVFDIPKQAMKRRIGELITLFGGDGKAWTPEVSGLSKDTTFPEADLAQDKAWFF